MTCELTVQLETSELSAETHYVVVDGRDGSLLDIFTPAWDGWLQRVVAYMLFHN